MRGKYLCEILRHGIGIKEKKNNIEKHEHLRDQDLSR